MMMPTKFGIPPRQKRKKKDAADTPAEDSRTPVSPGYLDLTIETTDEGELVGCIGERVYALLEASKVSVGDVWTCMIGNTHGPVSRREAVPMTIVSKAEVAEPEPEKTKEPVQENTVDMNEYIRQIEKLKAELSETKDKLKEKNEKLGLANLKIGRLEKKNAVIPKLKEEKDALTTANFSLKTQVRVLEKKNPETEIQNLESERDHYKDLYEAQQKIIDDLRATINLYETGGRNNPQAVTTYLTGPTGIHCNLLDDGSYRVYFSPGRKVLRFIPDEKGMVECRSREVTIPAIAAFSGFEKIRSLGASCRDGEVVVELG